MKPNFCISVLVCFAFSIPPVFLQKVFCPPLSAPSNGVELKCYSGPDVVDCLTKASSGTTASYNCKSNFVSSSGSNDVNRMICQQSGQWSEENLYRSFSCSPTDVKPSVTTTDNDASFTPVQTLALNLHNKYRSAHGAPPVKLNSTLNADAQSWADSLINTNSFSRGQSGKYGQNLYESRITGGVENPEDVVTKAIESWYSSKASSSNPPSSSSSGSRSFTQMVWKATTDIGVGVSSKNGRTIVVVYYSPGGNIRFFSQDPDKFFRENVQL